MRTVGKYYAFIRLVVLISLWLDMKNLQYLREYQNERRTALKTKLTNRIAKEKYSAENFVHDAECWICYKEYVQDELVTRLTCDHRHYFHTDCLIKCFEQGLNACPFCRKPIVEDPDKQSYWEQMILEFRLNMV